MSPLYVGICLILAVLTLCLLRNAILLLLRHEVISLRNKLFVEWAKMGLPFNTPAYTSLRWSMNAALRFAHKLSPARILPIYAFDKYYKGDKPDTVARFEKRLTELQNQQAKALLSNYASRFYLMLGLFFFFGSISGILLVFCILTSIMVRKICRLEVWKILFYPQYYGRRAQTLAFR